MGAYTTSVEHIQAELARLDLLLRAHILRARQRHSGDEQGLAGLYISEAEVDSLLEQPLGTPTWATAPLPPDVAGTLQVRLDAMAADIAARVAASAGEGVLLRLVALAQVFRLATFDVDVLLLCLAPELDRRYERLYAYLHDDINRRLPSVDLALGLFCHDAATGAAARSRFGPQAPLLHHGLVQLADEPGPPSPTLRRKALHLDARIARFLLDDDTLDERLRHCARLVGPSARLDTLVFPDPFAQQLARLFERVGTDGGLVLGFQGGAGVGKKSAASACGRALGAELLVLDGARLASLELADFAERLALVGREARLQGALLYWEQLDALLVDERRSHLDALTGLLEQLPQTSFVAGEATWEPGRTLRDRTFVRVTFPEPGHDERLRLWRAALAADRNHPALAPDVDLVTLANAFRLSGGQIHAAAATARGTSLARASEAPYIGQTDLQAACRLHSGRRLDQLAQQIRPHYGWDDIVLPDEQREQLREIFNQVRYRALVYDAWGFERKLATGKGLNVLFAGPPGTGKTMAADVLAHTLGLDLYKIDLSGVVSKYIGETEKNLARVFAEARASNAILFFDEADALFGKRTHVRDAHDRYANIEVSYLLQQMEAYDGVVILATNLRKNMDEAFVRRLHFTVEFPVPDVADRRRIWAQVWPDAAPRDPALDLEFMAQQIDVAGGAIRNIALASAFLAASNGGVVTMQHLIHATQREYQKMGKVLTSREFGEYVP